MVNIAVMGYGTVGSGVVEVINTNGDVINQRAGNEINIKYVLDLRDFPGDPIQEKIVHHPGKRRKPVRKRPFIPHKAKGIVGDLIDTPFHLPQFPVNSFFHRQR